MIFRRRRGFRIGNMVKNGFSGGGLYMYVGPLNSRKQNSSFDSSLPLKEKKDFKEEGKCFTFFPDPHPFRKKLKDPQLEARIPFGHFPRNPHHSISLFLRHQTARERERSRLGLISGGKRGDFELFAQLLPPPPLKTDFFPFVC